MFLSSLLLLLFSTAATAAQEQQNHRQLSTGKFSSNDITTVLKHGHLRETFRSWVGQFRKEYGTAAEELRRFAVWLRNHEYIERHNNQVPPPSFKLGHNHFSDLTNDEYQRMNALGRYRKTAPPTITPDVVSANGTETSVTSPRHLLPTDLPDEIDWVAAGAVSPVRNQGTCGSCWSFSAVEALEGAKFIMDGELAVLSEQMLMDCASKNHGCDGGTMTVAFYYVKHSDGLCTEEAYPYEEKTEGNCRASRCARVPDTKVAAVGVVTRSEEGLRSVLAQQPVSVGIQSYLPEFQLYSSGVFDFAGCGAKIDHGVLAVGYGHDADLDADYWTIKNSWGPNWGESGYIRLARESDSVLGTCGIYKQASYPVLERLSTSLS